MDQSEFVFSSEIHPDLTVIILYPASEKYQIVAAQFKSSGHAFLLHDQNIMVVDGAVVDEDWFTADHLLVIQAHEIAHWLAGHGKNVHAKGRDEAIEKEADWLGYNLLLQKGYSSAANLHKEEYISRYNSDPDTDSEMMNHLKSSLSENYRLRRIIDTIVEDFGKVGSVGFHGYGAIQPGYVLSSKESLGYVEKEKAKSDSNKKKKVKISRAFLRDRDNDRQ